MLKATRESSLSCATDKKENITYIFLSLLIKRVITTHIAIGVITIHSNYTHVTMGVVILHNNDHLNNLKD